ncbi:hypothetical protein N7535_003879 [Penicillium sp. DV-2018c]|nr:hypothetical protein N7461_000420 [Penicillium sp. DV-2018c]KAJ5576953.1 hypothetical protein N7535_003879 [Penicillium sp. DV-2018c]
MGCITWGVVLPFFPPALESSRQKSFDTASCANTRGATYRVVIDTLILSMATVDPPPTTQATISPREGEEPEETETGY